MRPGRPARPRARVRAEPGADAAADALGVPAGATGRPSRRSRIGAGSVTPVDAFVLARLEAQGIAPSPPADKRTLIRRATIDLWGIPPTAEEVDAFEADDVAGRLRPLVDRLLASPRYGERWGRHWLDVARYADTKGYVFTQERRYPYAYTYRDYVIDGVQRRPAVTTGSSSSRSRPTSSPEASDTRPLAALGFLTVGRRFLLDQNEIIDDRIDVVSRGLLGLTVTCARCHDHKFDPIPTDDYYSLYGVFASSVEPAELPVAGSARRGQSPDRPTSQRKLDGGQEGARRLPGGPAGRDPWRTSQARLSQYLKAAHEPELRSAATRKLDERALADKLDARRLRALIDALEASPRGDRNGERPGLGPWHAFAALPREGSSRPRSAEVRRKLGRAEGPEGAGRSIRWSPRSVLGSPPSSMDEVVERYVGAVRPARGALEGAGREVGRLRDGLARARVGVAPPGALRHRRAAARLDGRPIAAVPRSDASAASSMQFNGAIERLECDASRRARRGRWC